MAFVELDQLPFTRQHTCIFNPTMRINIWALAPWTHSPVPRSRPSTPVALGTGPNYKACSSPEACRDSWTKTDGRIHSCRCPRAPHCRRSAAGGSPGHSWPNTGGEERWATTDIFAPLTLIMSIISIRIIQEYFFIEGIASSEQPDFLHLTFRSL